MSESVSGKELMVECLTPTPNTPEWAALTATVLGRTDLCPPMVRLIELRRGLLPPSEAERVADHAEECRYCGPWVQDSPSLHDDPRGESQRRFEEAIDASLEEEDLLASSPPPGVSGPATPSEVVLGHSGTFTSVLGTTFGDPRQLLEDLSSSKVIPYLLAGVGLSRDLEPRFQQFARAAACGRCPDETVWLPWVLEQFAREELGLAGLPCVLDAEDWEGILTQCARRFLAESPPAQVNPDDARRFYEYRLNQGPVHRDLPMSREEQEELAKETDVSPDAVGTLMRQEGRYTRTLMARAPKAVGKR